MTRGIIVGCDNNQEWLLPWFWHSYSLHNSYPVTFMDFGMSDRGKAFCHSKGLIIPVSPIALQEVSISRKEAWESSNGKGFWHSRPSWFAKPSAFMSSPYEEGLWLDLDCEVHGSLEPLFEMLKTCDIALAREPEMMHVILQEKNSLLPGQSCYNSGVVVFKKQTEALRLWQKEAELHNDRYRSDQDALSFILYIHDLKLTELPAEYNWLTPLGENPKALISHYVSGKEKIRILKGMKKELWPLVENLLQSVSV